MKGKVILFNNNTHKGVIEDKYKNRYSFHIGEWLSEQPITIGKEVNFEIPKEEALNIREDKKRNFFKFFFEKWGKNIFGSYIKGKKKSNKEDVLSEI